MHHRPDAVPRVGRDAARRERAHPRRAGPHAGLAARHCARAFRPGRHRMLPVPFRPALTVFLLRILLTKAHRTYTSSNNRVNYK